MIYELRSYDYHANNGPRLQERFRKYAIPLLQRHGVRIVGFWEAVIGDNLPRVRYMLAFESMAEREQKMAAFYADAEWQAAMREYGSLTDKIHVEFLTETAMFPAA